MQERAGIARVTGFSGRQLSTIAAFLAIAIVMFPLGARAASTLFTLVGGTGFSQQNVTAGAAQVQSFPGVPVRFSRNGTTNLSDHTAKKLLAVRAGRFAFTSIAVDNGGTDEAFVQMSTVVASSTACAGTAKDVYSIAAPPGQTVDVSLPQAMVLPNVYPGSTSTTFTCVFATASQGSFVYFSYNGYAADATGSFVTFG